MRTYGSRSARQPLSLSSPPSTLSSSPTRPPLKRVREDDDDGHLDSPLAKKLSTTLTSKTNRPAQPSLSSFLSKSLSKPGTSTSTPRSTKPKPKQKLKAKATAKEQPKLHQLHFTSETSILVTCPTCALSYTCGAPDDEALHRVHCTRVTRGAEWGREEERAGMHEEVAIGVRLKDKRRGRIISTKLDCGGKVGAKVAAVLESVNLALTAPPLPASAIPACKAYLFLTTSAGATAAREQIVGCCITQRIETAYEIAAPNTSSSTLGYVSSSPTRPSRSFDSNEQVTTPFAEVGGLTLMPTPLPTPLGIARLFTSLSARRSGVARALLDVAAQTAVHGCPLDPRKGEVAFTQPTDGGRAVMLNWAGEKGRVYEE